MRQQAVKASNGFVTYRGYVFSFTLIFRLLPFPDCVLVSEHFPALFGGSWFEGARSNPSTK